MLVEAGYKDFPDIMFSQNATNNIVLAGHPGHLFNGTFRDPTSDALQRSTVRFTTTNIGTVFVIKCISSTILMKRHPVYNTICHQMINYLRLFH